MRFRGLISLFALIIFLPLKAQEIKFLGNAHQDEAIILQNDTLRLPFPIATEKRLSLEDIEIKKEGRYLTGLPELSSDPIRGFTFGANACLFNNLTKDDPFFYYTPYRVRYAVGARVAQNGRIDGEFNIDIPFAFNTKWRLRGDIIFANDPHWQYFGLGAQTLNPLSYIDKQTGQRLTNAQYDDYEENLQRTRYGMPRRGEDPNQIYTDYHFNEIDYSQFLVGLAAERSFYEGRLRLMFGLEYLKINIDTYDFNEVEEAIDTETGQRTTAIQGRTQLTQDYLLSQNNPANSHWARQGIGGYHGGRIILAQSGIMWDTRDLEPDPSSGVFAELAQEISAPWMGSEFDFTKHLLQGIFYKKLLPQHLGRTVLTGRFALGYIRGSNIPFTEVMDLWGSSEGGGIPVLGGSQALRGFRESRFGGMLTGLTNWEIRARFYQTRILNQHLAFYAVPFFDAGRVWDSLEEMNLKNFKTSRGLGARIAWNQATILRFDYAKSNEGNQFFFVLGHTF
ncbi:Omp85 family outer membrane protein [Salegentibacter sp. HM20]